MLLFYVEKGARKKFTVSLNLMVFNWAENNGIDDDHKTAARHSTRRFVLSFIKSIV